MRSEVAGVRGVNQVISPREIKDLGASKNSDLEVRALAIEAIEKELASIEGKGVKKARLLKVAWLVTVLINTAIFFVVPVAVILGISLWIPVISVMVGLTVVSMIGANLRRRRREILRYYETLKAMREELSRSGNQRSSLEKFNLTRTELFGDEKKGIFEKKLLALRKKLFATEEAKSELIQNSNRMDLAGGALISKVKVEELLEKDPLEVWDHVGRAVEEINSGFAWRVTGDDSVLSSFSSHLLSEGGVRLEFLPFVQFEDFFEKLRALCSRGVFELEKVVELFSRYEAGCFHLSLFQKANPLSDAVLKFKERAFLVLAATKGHLECLNELNREVEEVRNKVERLEEGEKHFESLAKSFRKFGEYLSSKALLKKDGSEELREDISRRLEEVVLENKKLLEKSKESGDLYSAEVLDQFLQSLREGFSELKSQFYSGQLGRHVPAFVERLYSLSERCLELDRKSNKVESGALKKARKMLRKSQCNLISYLGGLSKGSFVKDLRLCMRGAQSVSEEVEKSLTSLPENRLYTCRLILAGVWNRLQADCWGVSSSLSAEEIMTEKKKLEEKFHKIVAGLEALERDFGDFKDKVLIRIRFGVSCMETEEIFNHLQSLLIQSPSRVSPGEKDLLKETEEVLKQLNMFQQLEGRSLASLSPADIPGIVEKYKGWAQIINEKLKEISEFSNQVTSLDSKGVWALSKMLLESEASLEAKQKDLIEEIKKNREVSKIRELIENPVLSTQGELKNFSLKLSSLKGLLEGFQRSVTSGELIKGQSIDCANQFLASIDEITGSSQRIESLLKVLLGKEEGVIKEEVFSSVLGIQSAEGAKIDEIYIQKHTEEIAKAHKGIKKILEGFANSVDNSLKKMKIAESLINSLFSLALMVIAISLINVQLWWFPLLFAGLGVAVMLFGLGFDALLDKKRKDLIEAEVAVKLSSSDKIYPSAFGNKKVERLAHLQDRLGLEGFHRAWAHEIVEDYDRKIGDDGEIPSREEQLRVVKGWKVDLDRKMKKRFGVKSTVIKEETSSSSLVSAKERSREAVLAEISEKENALLKRLERLDYNLLRHHKRENLAVVLENSVAQNLEEKQRLLKEKMFHEFLIQRLQEGAVESAKARGSEKNLQESEEYVRGLLRCIENADNGSTDQEKRKAFEEFDTLLLALLNHTNAQRLKDALTVLSSSRNAFVSDKEVPSVVGGALSTSLNKIRKANAAYLTPVVNVAFGPGCRVIQELMEKIDVIASLSQEDLLKGKGSQVLKELKEALSLMKQFKENILKLAKLRFGKSGDVAGLIPRFEELESWVEDLKKRSGTLERAGVGRYAFIALKRIERELHKQHVSFRKESKALKQLCILGERHSLGKICDENEINKNVQKIAKTPPYLLLEEIAFNKARYLACLQKYGELEDLERKAQALRSEITLTEEQKKLAEVERRDLRSALMKLRREKEAALEKKDF